MSKTFADLSMETFGQISEERKRRFASASDEALPKTFPVNELAKKLHPNRQYMKVARITQMCDDAKCYRLVPDADHGTTECAYFEAGQYLNVFLDINGMAVNRAYSISSSPKDALNGFYELTIKAVQDGLVSNYIFDNWKEGDKVEISGPSGFFTYSKIRDAKTVVGVAGGSGITPFLSMAKDIVSGNRDFNLVILYGSRSSEGILYKKEFDELSAESNKIQVVHVLSNEEKEGYEYGFISEEIIKKYAPKDAPYSVFMCGPQVMYQFVDKELQNMQLEKKYIRHELFGEVHNPNSQLDYPGTKNTSVKITVTIRDTTKTIIADPNDTIMHSLEKNGIAVPSRCRSGECGFCHSVLQSGEVYIPKSVDGRRLADFKFNRIHPCVSFPLSDIEIEVPASK
ncbi:hypothetical protein C0033_04005 [Clostridium sp. chh4-2]|uniref:iron-sulfur cluster-binding domain-containing protein n=1 Tax=Clostridium sp. chh4-2 TaxID=2067550 RepID=UPI000CCE7C1A|nr:iron-sulfur cluster-binding domain-containing protein [Clostridium sp. chh4-2]PNV63257.1 hypothetical protein C0033_04005 [Clostridium sp. chh4-2]